MSVVRNEQTIDLLAKMTINATNWVYLSFRKLKYWDYENSSIVRSDDLAMGNKTSFIVRLEN